MNFQKLQENVKSNIDNLVVSLKNQQLHDGGFKGYHLFDKKSAFIAALLLSFHIMFIFYSQQARSYSMLLLITYGYKYLKLKRLSR